jgi:hypothetical protein
VTIRDIDNLLETVKWPVAVIVLGVLFAKTLGGLIGGTPPATSPVAAVVDAPLVASIASADASAISNPVRFSYDVQLAAEARKILASTTRAQRKIGVMPGITTDSAFANLLRVVGFDVSVQAPDSSAVIGPAPGTAGYILYRNDAKGSTTPIATASNPADGALQLAVVAASALNQ